MKFHFLTLLCGVALSAGLFTACDDTASEIGTSIAGADVKIVVDSSFTASGKTVIVNTIRPKTSVQLIGRISVPEYGTLESDVVTQFLPSTELDTAEFTYENVDSIFLNLRYANSAFIGDSVAPMQLSVYPLTKQITSDITSSFNPDGYYNPTPLGTRTYNASTFKGKTTTSKEIDVKLPVELGRRLFKAFEDNPSDYANGQIFARDVFPGLYLRSTYGSGRLTQVTVCAMTVYLRKIYTPAGEEKPDTIDAEHLYYLTTPEVVSNNNIRYTMSDKLRDMIAQGHTMMIAPCGSEIEFTFPLQDIISAYRGHKGIAVINGLSMSIPVDSIENRLGVTPPPYALMVLKKDRDEFFAKNKLTDNITSFYATYNSATATYDFSSMRSYITTMLEKDEITPEDYTFSLVPVNVSFEQLANSGSYYYYQTTTSETESEIQPYATSPVMADVHIDKAKIKLTYSLQTQK